MNKITALLSLFLFFLLAPLSGCGDSSAPPVNPVLPLSAKNLNLIFVVSEDIAFSAPGDINPNTANLTNQGLQRTLLLATYL